MKRVLMFVAAALALAACSTPSTQDTSTPPPADANVGLHVAPLQYHMRTLPNGLRVYALPDPNTANVSVQVWYNVGSKNDPLGRYAGPDEVARLALWLASDASGYSTGSEFLVDGGSLA